MRLARFILLLIAALLVARVEAAPAVIASPQQGAALGTTQLFQWNDASADLYQLWIGRAPGEHDLGYFPAAGTTSTSVTASGIPADGRTLYVRLWSLFGDTYQYTDSTYTAAAPAAITSPQQGATLGASELFQWSDASADLYQLWIGSEAGEYDVGYFPASGTTSTSVTASGIPGDGRRLYVRLWSLFGDTYRFTDSTYTAANTAGVPLPPKLVSPADGSQLAGDSQLFEWEANGALGYQLWVGAQYPGGHEIGLYPPEGTTSTSVLATGLPLGSEGSVLYVRLYSWSPALPGDTEPYRYQYSDYTFKRAIAPPPPFYPPAITSPPDGSTLDGETQIFGWTNGSPRVDGLQLWIGNSVGANDLLTYYPDADEILPTYTGRKIYGLPVDGRTIHVRLWYRRNPGSGFSDFSDFTYKAATSSPPTPAAIIAGSSMPLCEGRVLEWTNIGASLYQVWIGSTAGTYDYGYFPAAGTTATSIAIPAFSCTAPAWVRLWSLIDGTYYFRDYDWSPRAPLWGDAAGH